MARNNLDLTKSTPEKEVEGVPANFLKFCKPVSLYTLIQNRSQTKPTFLGRCLSYKIKTKRQNRSQSNGTISFNYMDTPTKILLTEVVKNFSCPFCEMPCGGFQGIQHHLLSSHEAFDYKVWQGMEDHPEIDVSVKPDASRIGVQDMDIVQKQKDIPFSFCVKNRTIKQKAIGKKLKLKALEVDLNVLPRDRGNEVNTVNDGRISSRSQLAAERTESKSVTRLKSRQFYHSQTYQPMSIAEVMSDADSEGEPDDDSVDLEENLRLARLKNVSHEAARFLHLWNKFVRKNRVLADGHIPWACEGFTKLYAKELNGSQSFFRWWIYFRIKLFDHGLITRYTFDKCTTILERAKEAPGPSNSPDPPSGN